MKISFDNRLEAIDWIAQNVEDEKTFEKLRELLNYNFIYKGAYFLDTDEDKPEIRLEDDTWEN